MSGGGMGDIDRRLSGHLNGAGTECLVVRGLGVDVGLAGYGITLCGDFVDVHSEPERGVVIGPCWHCAAVQLEREAWRAEQGL